MEKKLIALKEDRIRQRALELFYERYMNGETIWSYSFNLTEDNEFLSKDKEEKSNLFRAIFFLTEKDFLKKVDEYSYCISSKGIEYIEGKSKFSKI
jgi:hypothetical protein